MVLLPLTSKTKAADALRTSPYATDLDAATEASSSHVTTKCVTSSYTLFDEPSPLTVYVVNPSSTRATEDQRKRYMRLWVIFIGGRDFLED